MPLDQSVWVHNSQRKLGDGASFLFALSRLLFVVVVMMAALYSTYCHSSFHRRLGATMRQYIKIYIMDPEKNICGETDMESSLSVQQSRQPVVSIGIDTS
jgi:hypothetical protein